jgi:hypothetical protein
MTWAWISTSSRNDRRGAWRSRAETLASSSPLRPRRPQGSGSRHDQDRNRLRPRRVFSVDLDAYFARIGYDGPREPTLAVLRAIHQKHPDAIAFENVDVLLGKAISLDPADIDAKLITAAARGLLLRAERPVQAGADGAGLRGHGPDGAGAVDGA